MVFSFHGNVCRRFQPISYVPPLPALDVVYPSVEAVQKAGSVYSVSHGFATRSRRSSSNRVTFISDEGGPLRQNILRMNQPVARVILKIVGASMRSKELISGEGGS